MVDLYEKFADVTDQYRSVHFMVLDCNSVCCTCVQGQRHSETHLVRLGDVIGICHVWILQEDNKVSKTCNLHLSLSLSLSFKMTHNSGSRSIKETAMNIVCS